MHSTFRMQNSDVKKNVADVSHVSVKNGFRNARSPIQLFGVQIMKLFIVNYIIVFEIQIPLIELQFITERFKPE